MADERRHWRNIQMLYRRYNRAALVTVAVVAGLMVLLLLTLPPVLARSPAAGRRQGTVMTPHGSATTTSPAGAAPGALSTPSTRGRLLEFEAESPDNTLNGSAFVAQYPNASGGRLVRAIGFWGPRTAPGALRFNGITVPRTGLYTVVFYFVDIGANAMGTVIVTSSVAASSSSVARPVEVAVTGSSGCCARQQVQVRLRKGTNSITFANSGGEAPAIDKITISIS